MNIFQKIYYGIQVSDNDEFLKAIARKDVEIKDLTLNLQGTEATCDALQEDRNKLKLEVENLNAQIPKDTDMDIYCSANFKKISPIAYKNKMKFNGKYYSVSLQEMITPDAYEVLKLKKSCDKLKDRFEQFQEYGNKTAQVTTWTDDKNLDTSGDLYLYPAQVIADKKGDCEDIQSINASMDLEIGMCWGFYYPETKRKNADNKFGHAFNGFIYDGKLFMLDSTGNVSMIEEYTGDGHFTINYIITKKQCYEVDGSVRFGDIAGW